MRDLKRLKKYDELVDRLARQPHPDTGQTIYPTYRELMVYAAVVGYEEQAREPLSGDLTIMVEGRVFERGDIALDTLYLIVLAVSKDINILRAEKEDEALQIFEEYANGGLRVLSSWLSEYPQDLAGDQALLLALKERGYCSFETPPEVAPGEVVF